jgi:(1->4)-alpha-D-glucan 1-alpha-D-glucosylmutase
VRRAHPELFLKPAYTPLYANAGRKENVCAFMLRHGRQTIVAVAPRLFSGLMGTDDFAPMGRAVWADASLPIPPGRYENVLTGETLEADETGLAVAEVLRIFPVALLVLRQV